MTSWGRIVLGTVAFWAIWLGLAGLAATVHGDCGAGATQAEAAACVDEKRWVAIVAMAIGAIVYAVALRLLVKRSRP